MQAFGVITMGLIITALLVSTGNLAWMALTDARAEIVALLGKQRHATVCTAVYYVAATCVLGVMFLIFAGLLVCPVIYAVFS